MRRRHSGPVGGDCPETADTASDDSGSSASASGPSAPSSSRPRRRTSLSTRAQIVSSTSPTSRVDRCGSAVKPTVEASSSR